MNHKGFLLIDGAMNTYLLEQPQFEEMLHLWEFRNIDPHRVKPHGTKAALDKDVRVYLKGDYFYDDRNEDDCL